MVPKDARKAEPVLLVVQFLVCVVCWTAVVFLLEGTVSTSGFVASIVTGLVLVAITVLLVRFGLITAPVRPAELAEENGPFAEDG